MRRFFRGGPVVAVVLGLAFLAPALAGAQTGTGRISGLVKDASGAVVPGVTVLAVHEETGVRSTTVTTEAGLFLFREPASRSVHRPGGTVGLPAGQPDEEPSDRRR